MTCNYHFRNCRHSYSIRADKSVISIFCRSLISRACACKIDTALKFITESGSNFECHSAKILVIRAGHIRKTRSELSHIRTDQRIRQMADMVCNHHHISHLEVEIHSSCCIGNKKILYSKNLHNPYWQGYQIHRVSLIIMEASLHGNNELSAKLTSDKITLMSDSR